MNQLLMQLMQGSDPSQFQDMFQQSFVDPAMLTYEQQVLPAIQQRFVDAGAGSSSALNQALAQSAGDLSTMLGSQMGQFTQNQQQLNQQGQLGALSALQGSMGQRSFDPMIQQQQGLLGPLIGAGGQIGAAMMSSKEVKKNFRPFDKGLKELNDLEPVVYDYKESYGDANQVGFIAEDVPKEVTQPVEDVLGIQLMGMIAILVNSVKELSAKVQELEAK
jgi:hypothetical protein